jgi:hypothetical protein
MDGHYHSGGVVVGQVTYVITSTPAARCGERPGETHFEHATPELVRREEDVDAVTGEFLIGGRTRPPTNNMNATLEFHADSTREATT